AGSSARSRPGRRAGPRGGSRPTPPRARARSCFGWGRAPPPPSTSAPTRARPSSWWRPTSWGIHGRRSSPCAPPSRRVRGQRRARYVAGFPEAASPEEGARYWALTPEEVELSAGEESARLSPAALRIDPATDPLAAMAGDVCAHMNDDHAEAVALYCEVFRG